MVNERITINKWEEFQPRKDRANHTWFRVDNTVPFSEALHGLDAEQRWFWICLLSYASKKGSASFEYNADYFTESFKVSKRKMDAALEILNKHGAITFDRGDGRTPDDTVSLTTNKQTDKQTKQTNTPTGGRAEPPADFDFESVYEKFPRKEGKSRGMREAQRQVGNDAMTFAALKQATDHYAALVIKRGTEIQFVKHWSSFIGTAKTGHPWREYINRPAELDAPAGAKDVWAAFDASISEQAGA